MGWLAAAPLSHVSSALVAEVQTEATLMLGACVCTRMTARAGSWRRVVGLDLMAPGCVDRVPHDSRHSRARGKTSLCRV